MNEETEPVITLEMFQERQARITEALDACLRKSDRTPLAPDLPLFATGTGRAMRRDELLRMVSGCAQRAGVTVA